MASVNAQAYLLVAVVEEIAAFALVAMVHSRDLLPLQDARTLEFNDFARFSILS